jgi:hypothetical protein
MIFGVPTIWDLRETLLPVSWKGVSYQTGREQGNRWERRLRGGAHGLNVFALGRLAGHSFYIGGEELKQVRVLWFL